MFRTRPNDDTVLGTTGVFLLQSWLLLRWLLFFFGWAVRGGVGGLSRVTGSWEDYRSSGLFKINISRVKLPWALQDKCSLVERGLEKRKKSGRPLSATAEPLAPTWSRVGVMWNILCSFCVEVTTEQFKMIEPDRAGEEPASMDKCVWMVRQITRSKLYEWPECKSHSHDLANRNRTLLAWLSTVVAVVYKTLSPVK